METSMGSIKFNFKFVTLGFFYVGHSILTAAEK